MIRRVSLLGLVILLFSSCTKNTQNVLPYTPVSESLSIAEPSNFPLTAQGGWVYHPGGLRGLIVYRQTFTGGIDDFKAYDRACPRHYGQTCAILEIDNTDLYLKCECDDSRWLLLNGFPEKEDSGFIQEYETVFTNGVVVVTN